MHEWTPWVKEDYTSYRKNSPRFCSEFGFQAPANYATIVRVIGDPVAATPASPIREEATQASQLQTSLDFGSIKMRHRQKSFDGKDDGDHGIFGMC